MPDERKRSGLGRGLSALMADVEPESVPRGGIRTLPLDAIYPNADQPRRHFAEEQIADLAASLREKGMLQPIIVRERDAGRHEIIAGERRWRAAQKARLHEVPVIVREMDDTEVLEVAIIENVQRVDLNPLEEAMGIQSLIGRFGRTQEEVAKVLGKSRSHVANLLRLLRLPPEVQEMLREGKLTMGHARALLGADDPKTAIALAERIAATDMSVREIENLLKDGAKKPKREPSSNAKRATSEGSADTKALEGDLSAALGTGVGVRIEDRGDGRGSLTLTYASLDDLDLLCELLTASASSRLAR